MRAVLDTNLLASGIVGIPQTSSIPGELLRRLVAGHFERGISEFVFEELELALKKPYFSARLPEVERQTALANLREVRLLVLISSFVQNIATHPEDDLVLATAPSAQADVLVTGDKALQSLEEFRGVRIMSPRDFLDLLDAVAEEMDPS